jgi:hypothetical protein
MEDYVTEEMGNHQEKLVSFCEHDNEAAKREGRERKRSWSTFKNYTVYEKARNKFAVARSERDSEPDTSEC